MTPASSDPSPGTPPPGAPRLYLVTDRAQTGGRPLAGVVGQALAAVREGRIPPEAVAVQLREKDLGGRELFALAAPIGSGLGIRNPYNLRIILEQATVPIIVDAGVGTASDAAVALELGCHGVLMNTAIAEAKRPVLMAEAMRDAVIAGRKAFRAGRIPRKLYANASSPLEGLIE